MVGSILPSGPGGADEDDAFDPRHAGGNAAHDHAGGVAGPSAGRVDPGGPERRFPDRDRLTLRQLDNPFLLKLSPGDLADVRYGHSEGRGDLRVQLLERCPRFLPPDLEA